jgi:pyruvate kinase
MARKAKIVATIGPASRSEEVLRRLFDAGMDVARLNFSHGTHEDHALSISLIRKLSKELGKPVAILQDLQGPKLRVGILPDAGIELAAGDTVFLSSRDPGSISGLGGTLIPMEVPDFEKSMTRGCRVLIDDGKLELQVAKVTDQAVEAKVVIGGTLLSRKGVNLPGADLGFASFTPKDRIDLEFGVKHKVDYIALSFVRAARDIIFLRESINEIDPSMSEIPIIAKLERPEAIQNLHEILHVTDGVMVARGDLGVETSPSDVPIMQKTIIKEANRHAKLVITATQMLDSMVSSPRPTRAEASDVANAIFDGSDAVMLSAESASGLYPVESVVMMDQIIRTAEDHFDEWGFGEDVPIDPTHNSAIAITRAVHEISKDPEIVGIAVFTLSGQTAILMAKTRPKVPILAFTPNERTYQRLNLCWGTTPELVPFANSVEEMLQHLEARILEKQLFQQGQQIAVISGLPVHAMKVANFTLLHRIGQD